ncbi:MAG: hypothetical protein C5B47_02995 [Verrucomicrobia bacterium]|nr:MAG: hypothetical protein C5B47_02995 [Verrucomicrobiota bacterium]
MITARQPLVGICLSALLGIAFSSAFSCWNWIINGLGLLIFWWILKGTVWILLVTACAFGCLHKLQTTESQAALFSRALASDIWQSQGIVTQVLQPVGKNPTLIVRTEKLRSGKTENCVSLRVLVPWKRPAPEVGTTVKWIGRMRLVEKVRSHQSRRADGIKRRAWLSFLGVDLEAYQVAATQPLILPKKWHIHRVFELARKRIEEAVSRGIEKNNSEVALIRALTLGASSETEKMLAEAFRRTGTYHIFSVSGLHVGMVAAIVWQTLRTLGAPHLTVVSLTIFSLFFYAGIAQFRPPALRAACMASILLAGTCIWRQAFVINSLAAAALCLLGWNTELLFRPGFQLSFIVVVTIALLAPPLYKFARRFWLPDPFVPRVLLTPLQRIWERFGLAVAAVVSVSTAAWVGSTPLLLWHFQSVSFSALFVNPLIVPLAFLLLSLAALTLLCDLFLGAWVASIFSHINLAIASGILAIVQWAAKLPWGFLQIPDFRS